MATDTNTNPPAVTGTAKPMADQAAAMMIQDMQSFLQGSQQIIMVAMAKAAAQAMNPNPVISESGSRALTALQNYMANLPTFATAIGSSASNILSEFGDSAPPAYTPPDFKAICPSTETSVTDVTPEATDVTIPPEPSEDTAFEEAAGGEILSEAPNSETDATDENHSETKDRKKKGGNKFFFF